MIIDGHAHACGEYVSNETINEKLKQIKADYVVLVPGEYKSQKTYNIKDYTTKDPNIEAVLKINKIARVLVKLTQMQKKIPIGNQYVYGLKKENHKIKQFYWVTKNEFSSIEEQFNEMKFDGIKLHQCWEYIDINSPLFNEVIQFATEKDIPVFIHLLSHIEVRKLVEFIKTKPKSKIIIAHNIGSDIFIEEDIKYFDNTYFDMSNTYFVSEYRLMKTIEHFGSTKVLLGSDTPYGKNALEKCIKSIDSLNITDKEKSNILGLNMKELLKI